MTFDPANIKVALIAGGKSGEREISLASGAGSKAALEEAGFQVTQLDSAKCEDLVELLQGGYDVAFLVLHGKYGEDGTMQGFLELAGIPYTGPNVWSSATAMDKAKSKTFYDLAGIPTPPSLTVYAHDVPTGAQVVEKLGSHCVVKPGTAGSALGVFIVEGATAVEDAMEKALAYDDEILVERYVSGTELTVAVLGNESPEALPVIQIVPQSDFYDFDSKYKPGGSQHLCPAPLSDEQTKLAQSLAVRAHSCLECEGVSRTDMIMEESGQLWVLETNTLPGMTATSLLPDAARVAGISFPELCTKLVEFAFERAAKE